MSPSFETRAVAVVARLLKYLDDANPDVGMGHSKSHFVLQAADVLGLVLGQYDPHQAEAMM